MSTTYLIFTLITEGDGPNGNEGEVLWSQYYRQGNGDAKGETSHAYNCLVAAQSETQHVACFISCVILFLLTSSAYLREETTDKPLLTRTEYCNLWVRKAPEKGTRLWGKSLLGRMLPGLHRWWALVSEWFLYIWGHEYKSFRLWSRKRLVRRTSYFLPQFFMVSSVEVFYFLFLLIMKKKDGPQHHTEIVFLFYHRRRALQYFSLSLYINRKIKSSDGKEKKKWTQWINENFRKILPVLNDGTQLKSSHLLPQLILQTTVTIPFHQKRTLRLRGVSEFAQGHAYPAVAPTVSDPSLGHLCSVRTSEPKYMGSDSGFTICDHGACFF